MTDPKKPADPHNPGSPAHHYHHQQLYFFGRFQEVHRHLFPHFPTESPTFTLSSTRTPFVAEDPVAATSFSSIDSLPARRSILHELALAHELSKRTGTGPTH